MSRGISVIDRYYDAIETVVRKIFFEEEDNITSAENEALNHAMEKWKEAGCDNRNCKHRADTCRFRGEGLEYLKVNGILNLCEFLRGKTSSSHFKDFMDRPWARRPGNYKP